MKVFGALLTIGVTATGGYLIGEAIGKTEEQKKQFAERGLLLGIFGGIGLLLLYAYICKNKKDTVNYSLHSKGRRVYEGICYGHRFNDRVAEHAANGKIFDNAICDNPKPRHIAANLEQKRIKRHKPIYNIQHNC